jgi:hypothetical protein
MQSITGGVGEEAKSGEHKNKEWLLEDLVQMVRTRTYPPHERDA